MDKINLANKICNKITQELIHIEAVHDEEKINKNSFHVKVDLLRSVNKVERCGKILFKIFSHIILTAEKMELNPRAKQKFIEKYNDYLNKSIDYIEFAKTYKSLTKLDYTV